MATLILTAGGSKLGRVGGAVGALIGQAIDARIFSPKGRQGPRLQDLKIQTSSYGAPIPRLFGTMRVAGTVIWATDLIEHRSRKGGKGRPSTTSYSYSASFAVQLSARPIRSAGRIWADGNLLRGAAGDWKSETGFRLHPGGEDQAADPFIASAEATQGTPAYRGCAYAVFENMALGPYGNRIPSLTFEVEADAGPVTVGAVLGELSDGVLAGAGASLRGFAASGDSVRAVVEALGAALPIALRDDGTALRLVDPASADAVLTVGEIGDGRSENLAAEADLPAVIAIHHYDPDRDYQAGVQQARRPGGRRTERIELPVAINAGEARGLAEETLARLGRERGRRSVRCGWARLTTGPGALVRLPDDAGLWRVAERIVDREGVRLDLRRIRSGSMAAIPAEPGRSQGAADRVHGPTVVHLLDLPTLTDSPADVPRLYVAAAGPLAGWRRAALLTSLDDGASWTAIGATAAPAIIGAAASVLAPAAEALIDDAHSVEVTLLNADMLIEDADDARLLAGANLALLGNELIQFGRAEPIGGANWRLSRLLRGRRDTGWAAATHAAGERFVLIEEAALLPYDPPLSAAGGTVRLMASGIGDAVPVETVATNIGEALRPPAPVQLRAVRRDDGGYDVGWIRSSRAGWPWLDGVDAPLAEDREAYRLSVLPEGGGERTYALDAPGFDYAAAAVAADRVGAASVTLSVVQLGTRAASRPATITLSLEEML